MALPGGPYGLTSAGFVAPSMAVIQSAIETDLQSAYGAGIALQPQSNFGQLVGVVSDRILDIWNLGLAIYTAQTSEGSTGVAEDAVNGLTGCVREPAEPSSVLLTLTGANATVITQGSIAAVTGQNPPQFATDVAATLAAANPWLSLTPVTVGAYVTQDTQVYYCTQSGTTAASGGPGTFSPNTAPTIPDGSAVWRWIGAGAAIATVGASATVDGNLAGPANTITVIGTPISGWHGVWNAYAATAGSLVETDSAYRLRRDATLGNEGKGYLNAIRAAVLDAVAVVNGVPYPVTGCTVFENDTDAAGVSGDIAGMPAHSIEALVQGDPGGGNPTVQTAWQLAVAEAIFGTIPAGIQPFAQTSPVTVVVTDSAGNPQTIMWSEPTLVTITVLLTATVPPFSVGDSAAMITQQILNLINGVTAGAGLPAGFNVDASLISAQAFIANVGVWQVNSCTVNGSSEVVIGPRQQAAATAMSITVTIAQANP